MVVIKTCKLRCKIKCLNGSKLIRKLTCKPKCKDRKGFIIILPVFREAMVITLFYPFAIQF